MVIRRFAGFWDEWPISLWSGYWIPWIMEDRFGYSPQEVYRALGSGGTRITQEAGAAGKAAAQKISRARILMKADAGEGGSGWTDQRIADALDGGVRTVVNVLRCCVEEGLEVVIVYKPRPDGPWQRKLDIAGEARLVALSCSEPPSHAQKNELKPWLKMMWCIQCGS